MLRLRQHAPLVANGGFLVLDELLPKTTRQCLRDEAFECCEGALEQRREDHDISGFRTGNPARWLRSTTGGPVQFEIYHCPVMADNISYLCGRQVKPTGGQGTYSYYDRKGHFLGLHRDINTCDATLITCLHRKHSANESGALRLYYKGFANSLVEIISDSNVPYLDIHLEQWQSILLLGGWVPHEVLPAAEDYERYTSVLCYEMI